MPCTVYRLSRWSSELTSCFFTNFATLGKFLTFCVVLIIVVLYPISTNRKKLWCVPTTKYSLTIKNKECINHIEESQEYEGKKSDTKVCILGIGCCPVHRPNAYKALDSIFKHHMCTHTQMHIHKHTHMHTYRHTRDLYIYDSVYLKTQNQLCRQKSA